jgi:hypothetical protein
VLLAMASAGTVVSSASAQDAPAPPAAAPAPVNPAPAAAPAPAPPAASDAAPPETKLQLAARLGFAVPFGDIQNGIAGAMPFWIEFGYRLVPQLMVGVYGRGGPGFTTSSCVTSCSGYFLGGGAEIHYQFGPVAGFDPWIGVGFGYETASFAGQSSSGFELINAQLGFDYTRGFGPFAGFSYNQYSASGQTQSAEWVSLGVRGTYDW